MVIKCFSFEKKNYWQLACRRSEPARTRSGSAPSLTGAQRAEPVRPCTGPGPGPVLTGPVTPSTAARSVGKLLGASWFRVGCTESLQPAAGRSRRAPQSLSRWPSLAFCVEAPGHECLQYQGDLPGMFQSFHVRTGLLRARRKGARGLEEQVPTGEAEGSGAGCCAPSGPVQCGSAGASANGIISATHGNRLR